jgi:hypothetical protein
MNIKITIIASIVMLQASVNAQNIGINNNGANPDNSAMLDVVSSSRGVLVPRVQLTATNAAGPITTPTTSLLVYNIAAAGAGATAVTSGYYYNSGTAGAPNWVRVSTDGSDWKILGNTGTTSGTNFLGTTDGQALDFRTNNVIRFRVANGNQVYAMSDGTAALPFYSWNSDANTGVYRAGTDLIGMSTVGVERFRIDNSYQVQAMGDGTAALPFYSWNADANTGMWRSAADNLSISAGGTETMRSNTTVTSFMREIQTRQTNANAGDILARLYDSGDDGVLDVYQNNTVDIRLHGNGESFMNINASDNRTLTIGDNASLYPTLDMIEVHSIGSAGGNNYAVNAYSDGSGDCIYAEVTNYGGAYGMASVNADNTIAGTQTFNTMQYVGLDVDDHVALQAYSQPLAGWGIGVTGQGGWYGVVSFGDFGGTGAKYFVIDHPNDPENKYLRHACIESNEVLNHYRGNVNADINGNAVVSLPDYFHDININFSYLLTAIGSPAPDIHVSKEINDEGKFEISGLKPGQKVSWTVEAERNDLYLQNNPDVRNMEPNKRTDAIGKYVWPSLYNQPANKGVFYTENPYDKKQRLAKEDDAKKETP